MTIKKLALALAITVAPLCAANAADTQQDVASLRVMTKFYIYVQTCNVDPSILDEATWDLMIAYGKQDPEESKKIGAEEAAKAQQNIAAIGPEKFCAFYGALTQDTVTLLHKLKPLPAAPAKP